MKLVLLSLEVAWEQNLMQQVVLILAHEKQVDTVRSMLLRFLNTIDKYDSP